MNIPMPPTDNLYKFVALSGVALIILAIYQLNYFTSKLNDKYDAYNIKLSAVIAEYKHEERKLKQLHEIVKNTIEHRNKRKKDDKNKLTILYSHAEIKEMLKEIDEHKLSIDIKNMEIDDYNKDKNRVEKLIKLNRIKYLILSLIGAVISYVGFFLWYHRIQKYQDISIKNEAFKERGRE